jgi:hypothetical protein
MVTFVQVLTTRDLQALIRQLSDESLHDLTGITGTFYYPIMRKAMYAWALDCGTYLSDEETAFFEDFMADIDIARSSVRVMLSVSDREAYEEVFSELLSQHLVPDDSAIVHVTQFWDMSDVYLGSRMTCCTRSPNMEYFWITLEPDWTTQKHAEVSTTVTWIRSKSAEYKMSVYGRTNDGWVRTFAGSRAKGSN